jgi:hypothetical protein
MKITKPTHLLFFALNLVVAGISSSAWANSGDYKIETQLKTFQANNAVSVDQFDAEFMNYSPSNNQLFALGENSVAVEVQRSAWSFTAYRKQEIFINAGKDTGQLYADINSRIAPTSDKAYAVDFDGYGIDQTGIGIGYAFELTGLADKQKLSVRPSFRVYNINQYREIQAKGNVEALADGSYNIGINTVERDTEGDFTFPSGPNPKGMGYALDLALGWSITEKLNVYGDIQDLWNHNTIDDTPTTVQQLNSNVSQFDQDGFLVYQPAIQGQNSRPEYRFRLPTKTTIGMNYHIGSNAIKGAGLQVRHISGLTMPKVSMQLNSPWKVIQGFEVGYENYFGAYELAAFFKYGGVRIGFDTLDDEKRRVEYLEFSLNFNL